MNERDTCEHADSQYKLGLSYSVEEGEDKQANLGRAIVCFQAALRFYNRRLFPMKWAMTEFNLGKAYLTLLDGDRRANLEKAIVCFQAALEVRGVK